MLNTQPVTSPLTWALSSSGGSSGKASALAPMVGDAQELLSREEDGGGEPLGVARMSSGGQQRWEASPGEPADKAARGRTCRSLQIQHTPKLRPAPAHKSFCKLLCPTSRCASTPSYTPRPSQASRRTRPPPSWLARRIVPDTSAWCETAPACQHPGLSSREAAKPYHSFPSPSQAIITQSGLLEEGASLQPGSKVTREQARPNETSSRVSPRQKK